MTAQGAGAASERRLQPPWSGGALPERTPGQALRDGWRSFRTAARLGLQVEANWTDPLPFVIYTIIKPVFATLMLVFMLEIISGGRTDPAFRAFVVIGSALWSFVVAGTGGFAQALLEDRERYRMFKYLYVSPNETVTIVLGRGIWKVAMGALGTVVVLALGAVFLGLPFRLGAIDWPALAIAMVLGITATLAVGMVLVAVTMQSRQESWQYAEAVSGALFLVVGAVFPLSVLPSVAQTVGLLIPLTWWMETVRRALFPEMVSSIGGPGSLYTQVTGSAAPGTPELLLALLVTTTLVTLAAGWAFRWSERRAKERGLFDLTTGS